MCGLAFRFLRATALLLSAGAITVLGSVVVPAPALAEDCMYPLGTPPGAGQVPRKTRDKDLVCVPKSVADTVQKENADSAKGVGHTPGSNGCVSGLVWREGFDGDSVCVTPARRSETWQQNLKAGVGSTGGQIKADAALLSAVNDARRNPGKYPPKGKTTVNGVTAKTTACSKPLGESWALDTAADAHNKFIAKVSKDSLLKDQGGHRNPPPSGPLSWAPSGPLVQSGYDKKVGEIVAWGQTTAAQAVVDWMQNDEGSNWGHRNIILDCDYTDAGAAHFAGGSAGHYWTVDVGTH
jgi:hypothetical protein